MFTSIIEWLVFLTVVGSIAASVGLMVYGVYVVVSDISTVNAVLVLTGLFGTVFSLLAPFIFNGVIPANNWGLMVGLSCWLVALPAFIILGAWAIERK
jgi:hypothetical protein